MVTIISDVSIAYTHIYVSMAILFKFIVIDLVSQRVRVICLDYIFFISKEHSNDQINLTKLKDSIR